MKTILQVSKEGTDLTEIIRQIRDDLGKGLVERDVAIRLALLAALAGEHLLLLGPPGTAKSALASRLRHAFADASYFERLLTRFTVPEELFGPLSISALQEDRYERQTAQYLPTASIAFLDEIFKANSAILNALLTLLNERKFDNGTNRHDVPLIAVIGASNELPEGEELDALYDRFLLRLHVDPVSDAAFEELLALRGEPAATVLSVPPLNMMDLKQIRDQALQVHVPEDVIALLCECRKWCAAEKIDVSDRRWRKIVKLLQVSALTNGREAVSIWDCWLLQHCIWEKPEQLELAAKWYGDRVGTSTVMDPGRLTRIVTIREARLQKDQEDRSQRRDDNGNLLYRSEDGKTTVDYRAKVQARQGKEKLFKAPTEALDDRGGSLPNRDRNGHGYTLSELQALKIQDPNYYHRHIELANWDGLKSYLAVEANWIMKDQELPALMESTRHKPEYVAAQLAQLATDAANVEAYSQKVSERIASVERDVVSHLWVTAEFAQPAGATLQQTEATVTGLGRRIKDAMQGYRLLPTEPADDDEIQVPAARKADVAKPLKVKA